MSRAHLRIVLEAVVLAGLCAFVLAAQSRDESNAGEHWVTTWATAQKLAAGGIPGGPPANLPATFADQTVRMIVHASVGGKRVRVKLSNMLGRAAAHNWSRAPGSP